MDGGSIDLSCDRYPGVIHPQGHEHLREFRQDPFPVFVYHVDGLELEKSVFKVHDENTTVIQYEVPGTNARRLHAGVAAADWRHAFHQISGRATAPSLLQ
jgi:glycogen debranching enzyme